MSITEPSKAGRGILRLVHSYDDYHRDQHKQRISARKDCISECRRILKRYEDQLDRIYPSDVPVSEYRSVICDRIRDVNQAFKTLHWLQDMNFSEAMYYDVSKRDLKDNGIRRISVMHTVGLSYDVLRDG